jgi:DNA topoisomerase-1
MTLDSGTGRPEVTLRDRRLARVVARCQDLPGQDLFQYVDDEGEAVNVRSDDVNAYLREIAGDDVTAKDFRTWAGTVLAYRALRALQPATDREARHNVVEAIAGPRSPSATRRPSHGGATSTPPCSRPTGTPPVESTADEEAAVVDVLRQRLELDAARGTAGTAGGTISRRATRRTRGNQNAARPGRGPDRAA